MKPAGFRNCVHSSNFTARYDYESNVLVFKEIKPEKKNYHFIDLIGNNNINCQLVYMSFIVKLNWYYF